MFTNYVYNLDTYNNKNSEMEKIEWKNGNLMRGWNCLVFLKDFDDGEVLPAGFLWLFVTILG